MINRMRVTRNIDFTLYTSMQTRADRARRRREPAYIQEMKLEVGEGRCRFQKMSYQLLD